MLGKSLTVALFIPAFVFNVVAFSPSEAVTYEKPVEQEEEIAEQVVLEIDNGLTTEQETWIEKLAQCESSGNPEAINPNDLDGTPSYGLFQFKPGTFIHFWRTYSDEIAGYVDEENVKGAIMDEWMQRGVIEAMVRHMEEVNWYQQFPACVRRLGVPPVAHSQ